MTHVVVVASAVVGAPEIGTFGGQPPYTGRLAGDHNAHHQVPRSPAVRYATTPGRSRTYYTAADTRKHKRARGTNRKAAACRPLLTRMHAS